MVGCASGEEAYTLALLLYGHALTVPVRPPIQVFATDIDEQAMAAARQGIYPDTIALDVSPERLQRHFTAKPGGYRVRRELRNLVLFAPHNLLRDPPFFRLDLIICRNMMISIDRHMQEQILQLFQFTLLPKGMLLLGSAESADAAPGLFTPFDNAGCLFQRRIISGLHPPPVPALPLVSEGHRRLAPAAPGRNTPTPSFDALAAQVLAQYGPPAVIVNQDAEIVYLARGAGRFLQFADGPPSSNLLKSFHPAEVVPPGAAARRAPRPISGVSGRSAGPDPPVRLQIGQALRQVSVAVQPLAELVWAQGHMLLLFYDIPDRGEAASLVAGDHEPLVHKLEEELRHTREELRAASEELETSKEELLTFDAELKHKVDELREATSNLLNLMASTALGTIFIDRELRLKRYTPSAQAIINLMPMDIGRPLAHLTHRLAYDTLIADATEVLATLAPVEREMVSQEGHWYLLRIQPFRTESDRIDGVVLTFVDITRRRAAEEALRANEERLRLLVESIEDYEIITYTLDNRVDSWNVGAVRIFGCSETEILGQDGAVLFTPEDRAAGMLAQEFRTALERGKAEDERWHIRKDGSHFYASGVMTPLHDTTMQGFVKVLRDLTERKRTEEALRESEARFRTVTDAVPQLIWTNDPDGRATYFNQRWYAYSGLSEEQSVGSDWQAIVHPDDAPASVEQWPQVLAAVAPFETDYRLRRADGAYRWYLGRNVPLRDVGGRITGWFGSATDIEELKQAEAVRRERAVLRQLVAAQETELMWRHA